MLGASLIAAGLLLSFLQPHLPLSDPEIQDLNHPLEGPSRDHFFGTDSLGRDVFSRTLAAAQIDLGLALGVTLLSFIIGVSLGAIAGLAGGLLDTAIMRLADAVLAFPFLILIIAVIAIVGPGVPGFIIGVTLNGWALYARVTRGEMLRVREQDYMLAAHTLGFSTKRILLRHGLPNVIRPGIVISMADVVLNILLLASLSYLGLGVQPPTAEWGGIIADGQTYLLQAWWIATLPGLVVVATGVVLSLIGDAMGDLLGQEVRLA